MVPTENQAKPVLMSWSGGKDSCLALYEMHQSDNYEIVALLTTITKDYDRISMHGVRSELLVKQVAALGLPLHPILIPKGATNQEYEKRFIEAWAEYKDRGIDLIVFGDLFLEDIKKYRDEFLSRHSLKGLYPVWQRNTTDFIREFIALGFKAIVTCVNGDTLGQEFAGRIIDQDFLLALPPNVDRCGENGEFHSFVFDGPNFKEPVKFVKGDVVQRDGFWFCDLWPQ